MPALAPKLRKDLENAVKRARRVAEAGAVKALEQLAVGHHEPWGSMKDPALRRLRNRLRAHGQQLGDVRDAQRGTQSITRLKGEVAYEHWHRMLFARYLAENDLLIEPESGQAMTMDECRELAREQGKDWLPLACGFAQQMLPEIFRQGDPVLEVALPPETRSELEDVLNELPREVFVASDSLGWVYQFWQADQKEAVNKSENKIGADELPAVTQLFTEDYMVDFLLDNTLGAWWAGKVLAANPTLAENAQSEAELREACALPGCPWTYLRFIKVARPSRSGSDSPDRDGLATTVRGLDPTTLAITAGENLPHWTCDRAIYHVCFRLADSVPQSKREEWLREREAIAEIACRENRELTAAEEDRIRFLYSERIEAFLDAGHGSCLMSDPGIAEVVAGALRHFDGQRYALHAWCVMPNHVHVIVEPLPGFDLPGILHSWKSFTAHEINRRLGRSGDVWQHDAYNHIIRTEKEYRFQVRYVWENPDKAGLRNWVARASRSGFETSPSPDRDGLATWQPAAGSFPGWPKVAKELTCLDPCMGSGHFVVAIFERLVALRIAEEGLDEKAAVSAVIRDNLFGLEIDPRCTQIAAFNLALAAWRRVGHCALPPMHLACSGLAPNARESDWLKLAGDSDKLQRGMARLYRLFQNGPVLGSLINPKAGGEGNLIEAGFQDLHPLLAKALAQESSDDAALEMAVTAQGIAKAAEILAGQFTLVATNVPYLGRGKQDDVLRDYCERAHPDAKADLATGFVERSLAFCGLGCSTALVTPQSWHFQTTFRALREEMLTNCQWDHVTRLGPRAFQTPMWDFNVLLLGLTRRAPERMHRIIGLDVSHFDTVENKSVSIAGENLVFVSQAEQLKNPEVRIVLAERGTSTPLSEFAETYKGLCSGDGARFQRLFWEVGAVTDGWSFQQGSIDSTRSFAGREGIFYWENGDGDFYEAVVERLGENGVSAWIRGRPAWGRSGVAVRVMGNLPVTRYTGELYDNNVAVIVAKRSEILPALWAFCESPEFNAAVRQLNQKVSVTDESFVQVRFDLAHWQKIAAEKHPLGLPKPFSSDPTQWLFNGHPAGSDQPLQVAAARLVGYQWPRQTGSNFPDCPALGPDGLEKLADKDGIVCLSATKGEAPAADRLNAVLAAAFGAEWSAAKARELIAATGSSAKSLAEWLSDDFFAQHCELFHQRPFVWHIWDGLRGGFSALVNYHRLAQGSEGVPPSMDGGQDGRPRSHAGQRTLEKLIYTYLGDWIDVQRKAKGDGVEGADARLTAAEHLRAQLELILKGEKPFDLFVRWKPLHAQPIGWNPDINDGVRLNIRPFMTAKPLSARGKNACILRVLPKGIKWDKDRGKEPERPKADFPWFWSWDGATDDFKGGATPDGNRWNDCHYTLATKQAARERQNPSNRL